MSGVIRLKVRKFGVPPGTVLIEDASSLTSGLRDSLARIVQYRLGEIGRGKLPDEAKQLTPVVLFEVAEGSGVLACRPLDIAGSDLQLPAMLAAVELVAGIREYADNGRWPKLLPAIVRNRLGAAVAAVMSDGATVELSVEDDGRETACLIDNRIRLALQKTEELDITDAVELVGVIYDINVKNNAFKIDAVTKRVTVPFDDDRRAQVDELRWKQVFVSGVPVDDRLTTLKSIKELRLANGNEEAGVAFPHEIAAEATEAFQSTALRIQQFDGLLANWDSYSASQPKHNVLQLVLPFIRDLSRVFLDYSIELPVPFVVPTVTGGVQFEWAHANRELELEMDSPSNFHFLQIYEDGRTHEGRASKWEAMRLVKWLATGERA